MRERPKDIQQFERREETQTEIICKERERKAGEVKNIDMSRETKKREIPIKNRGSERERK